jgi:thermitase
MPDGYAYISTIAQGINWAADKGAKVANVSYNGVSGSSTVQSAANYMRSKGGVVVVAAGNSGGLESMRPTTIC